MFILFLLLGAIVRADQPVKPTPAEIGRIPLLHTLPASGGTCRSGASTGEAQRRAGITRTYSWSGEPDDRLVAVSTDAKNQPRSVMVMAGIQLGPSKRAHERLNVMYDAAGRLVMGRRSYATTGTPANLSEDRQSGLLPNDTTAVYALARAVVTRCR